MSHSMRGQIPNPHFRLPRLMSLSNSNARRPHRPANIQRRETFPRTSKLDNNLMGFSLVPTWLHLLDNQPISENSYPFNLSPTILSTYTSKATSSLTTPLCFDSPLGTISYSNDVDRQHWEEEKAYADGEEQNDDFEAVYRSFRY